MSGFSSCSRRIAAASSGADGTTSILSRARPGPMRNAGTVSVTTTRSIAGSADHFGWFRTPRRRIAITDALGALAVLAGSALIIFGGA